MSLDDMVFGGGYAPETEEPPADFSDPRSTADQLVARMAQTAVVPQSGVGVDPRLTMDRLHRKAYEDYVLNPNPFPNAKVNQQPAKTGKGGGETDFSDFGGQQPGAEGEAPPADFSEFGEQTPLPQPRPPEANTETQQPLEPPAEQGPGYLEKAAKIVEPKDGEVLRKPLTGMAREAIATGIRGVDKTIDWGKRVYNEFQEAKPADKAQPSLPDTPNQIVQGVQSGVVGQTPKLSGAALEGFGWVLKSIEDAAREHGLGGLLTSNATGGAYGANTLIDYGKKIQGFGDEQQKALQPRVASYRNIRTDSIGDFLEDSASFAGFQLGQGVVSTAPGLLMNVAARRLGLGRGGQWMATMAPSFIQNYGDVYSDSKDDKDIQELIKSGKLSEEKLALYAMGAGTVMAALDVYGVEQILKEPAHGWPLSVKDLGKRIVKGYVRGTIAEGSTEGLQQVVSEWFQSEMGSNKSAYEQFISILDNALGGAITGGTMAGGRAAFPSSGTPSTPPFSPPSASPGPLGLGGPPPGAGPTPAGPGAPPPPAGPGLTPPDFSERAAASSPEEQNDILRQRGYSDEDIASMSPEQFQGEVAQGLSEGATARPGTRAAPLQPEDLTKAESVTNPTPTPAQREAGNYQHTHAELPELGLTGRNGLSIETDMGGTRQGPIQPVTPEREAQINSMAATLGQARQASVNAGQSTDHIDQQLAKLNEELKGTPAWTAPNMPAAYGRSKQIMGADSTPKKKQGLDFFIGGAPRGGNVYVIDQVDPKTGKFDEHKVMARFRSPTEAVMTYLKSYTDNAAARIGGLTMLTPDEFKEWTKDGHVTGPLSEAMKAKEKGGTGVTQMGSGESPSPAKDTGAYTAPEGAQGGEAAQQRTPNAATVGSVPTSDAAMKGIASLFGENEAPATASPQPSTTHTESSENKQTTPTAESHIEDALRETGVDPATIAPVVIHRAAQFMGSTGWDPVTAFGAAVVSLAYESDHAIYQELVNAYGQANVQAVLHAAVALEHGVRGEEGGAATGGAPAAVHGSGVPGGGEAGVQEGGEAAAPAETHQAAEAAAEPAEHPTARAGAEQPAGEPVQESVPAQHEQAAGAAETGSLIDPKVEEAIRNFMRTGRKVGAFEDAKAGEPEIPISFMRDFAGMLDSSAAGESPEDAAKVRENARRLRAEADRREAVEGKKPVDARAQLEAYARSIQLPIDSIMPKDLQLAFEFMEKGRDAGGALARAIITNGLIDGTIKADELQLNKEDKDDLIREADARRGGEAPAEGGAAPAPQGASVPEAGKRAPGDGEGGGQRGEQHAGAQPQPQQPGKPAKGGERPAAAAEQPAPAAGNKSEPAAAEQPAAAGSGQQPAAGLHGVREHAADEHPGLRIKSLETGRETTMQPRGTRPPPAGLKELAKNRDGKMLYEDANGVRSYIEDGVRITEAVPMRPTRGGVQTETPVHKDEFQTRGESLKDKLEHVLGLEDDANVPPEVLRELLPFIEGTLDQAKDKLSDEQLAQAEKLLNQLREESKNADNQSVEAADTIHGKEIVTDAGWAEDAVAAGTIKQNDKAGLCYPAAMDYIGEHGGTYAIGLVNTRDRPVYHAVVEVEKGGERFYHDPTLTADVFFTEPVFKRLTGGWVPVKRMSETEALTFGRTTKFMPDPKTLNLPTIAQVMESVRSGKDIPTSKLEGMHKTPGTNLEWSNLSQWMDAAQTLNSRRTTGPNYEHKQAHWDALTTDLAREWISKEDKAPLERLTGMLEGWFRGANWALAREKRGLILNLAKNRLEALNRGGEGKRTLTDVFERKFNRGEGFKTILEARKFAKETGFSEDPKVVEEAIEAAVVKVARDLVQKGGTAQDTFGQLRDLYSRQPILGTRTSGSVRDQAYSTPIPLAYAVDVLAGVTKDTTVYEPTAGNGALLVAADPKKARANEINPERRKNLEAQGFEVTGVDASVRMPSTKKFDVIVANPPFGVVKTQNIHGDSISKSFDMSDIQSGYRTNEIDHAIALRALESMKDDGKAVLILGGISRQITENEKRSDAYNGRAKREFFKALYDRYKVVKHVTVAGELYAKQGAAWPVDVIVIHGRGKSALSLPAVNVPRVLKTWDDVGKVLLDASARGSAEPVRSGAGEAAQGTPGGGPAEQHGGVSQPTGRSGTRGGSAAGEGPAGVRAEPVQQPGAQPAPGERTVAPGVPEPGRAGAEAAPGGRPSGLTAEDFGKVFDEYVGTPEPERLNYKSAGAVRGRTPSGVPSKFFQQVKDAGDRWIALEKATRHFDELAYENGKLKEDLSTLAKVEADLERDWKTALDLVNEQNGTDDSGAPGKGRPYSGIVQVVRDNIKSLIDRVTQSPIGQARMDTARAALRSNTQVAKDTVTSAVQSADAALSGLSALFGGPKTSMGLSFDPETYSKAKPLFAKAAEKFGQFKDNLTELMRRMLAELETVYGMTKDQLAKMRPYVIQFMQDVQSGAVNLVFPEAKTETKATEQPAPKQGMKKDTETENQVSYTPSSEGPGLGTLVPVNLKRATDEALVRLKEKVGNLDEFVRDELGYGSKEDMWEGLGAEQIDGVAMMIDGMKRNLVAGSIIGDQTGIGKGRQVAAMIRWAIRNNRVPVFFTARPKLYVEMYDDMKQIGMSKMLGRNPRILATNTDLKLPLDREDPSAKISTGDAKSHGQILIENGDFDALKKNYDMVFSTYAQIQTVRGGETQRRNFMRRLAQDAVFIFDESHKAGGQGAVQGRGPKNAPAGRSKLVRQLIQAANNRVVYSSATYAKRADVMDLYAATDMRFAVDNIEELGAAIASGGVPMQQVVAAMLVEAGQYIRRERSFAGVNYDAKTVEVDRDMYDQIAGGLASINTFSSFVKRVVKDIRKDMKNEGGTTRLDNAVGVEGAESTNFTSKLHNVINQMLLSMTAAPAIEEAVAALKNGEKPVLMVSNTMESFLQQYSEDAGLQIGKPMTATFNDVIDRYLERSREIRIKKAFGESSEPYYLTDADLDKVPGARQAWANAKEAIRNLPLDDLPVSPIDFMRNGIVQAGYTVSEITGRGLTVDYSGDEPVLARRNAKELSIKGSEATRLGFVDGTIDVVILNQSGAEGLSLHASERFKDQRRRLGIVVQAEGNIDTHMQLLGRIHRTGQVVTPNYIQLAPNVPAVLRPTSILMKKMASLNANTTAARDSAVTAKDVPDLMNEYGDEVAIQYVMDNPGMNERLGNPVRFTGDEPEEDGAMRRLTGRIPMLTLNEQESAWAYFMREYTQLLAAKEAAGENALEAKVMALKAITRERTEVRGPKNDSGSPFAAPVVVEKVRVVRLGKPYTSAEIGEKIGKVIGLAAPTEAKDLIRWLEKVESGESYYNKEIGGAVNAVLKPIHDDAIARFQTYKHELLDEIDKPEREETERARLDGVQNKWEKLWSGIQPGKRFTLKTSNGNLIAISLGVKQEGKPTNPLALSTWKADFAIADSGRHVMIPFSRLSFESSDNMRVVELDQRYGESYENTLAWFEIQQREAHENRFIATGNMLAAYDWLERKGKITHYTDSEGHIRQGILTARNFELGEHARKHGRPLDAGELQDWMVKHPGQPLTDKNNLVTVEGGYNGDLYVNVKANKKLAGFIFLDEKLIAAAGNDLEQRGRYFRVIVPRARIPGVIERLAELQSTFSIPLTDLKTEKVAGTAPSPEGEQAMGKVYTLNPANESSRRQIQREIQQIVDQALGPVVHVQFPNEIRTTPSMQDAWGGTAPESVPGSFLSANDLIKVVIGTGIERETAYHEIFHGYMKYYATKSEKALLKAETPRLRAKLAEIYNLTADEANRVDPEEVQSSVAAAYQIWRDTNNPAANSGIHIGVRAMLEKLWKMFQRIKNFLMFRGYNSFEDIVNKLYGGTFQRERYQGPQRVASPAVPLYRPYVPPAGATTAPEASDVANDNTITQSRPGWQTNMSRTYFGDPDTAFRSMVDKAPVLTERQKRKLRQEEDEIIARPGKDNRSFFTKEERRRLDEISDRIRASDARKVGPEQPHVYNYEDPAHPTMFGHVMPEWNWDAAKDYGRTEYRARLYQRSGGYQQQVGEAVTFGTLEGAQRWVETKIKTGKDIEDQIRKDEEPQVRREEIKRARDNIHVATRDEGLASLPKSTPERWVLKMFDGLEKGPRKQEFYLPEGRMWVAQGYEEGLDGKTFQIGNVDFNVNGKDNTGRGAFTNYLSLIEKEASNRSDSEGYAAVVVENVHNKRLAAFLVRRGYKNTSELFGATDLPDHIKELLFKNAPPHYFLRVGEQPKGPDDTGPPEPPIPIRPSHNLEEFLKNKFGEFLGPDEKAAGLSGGGTGRPRGLPPNMSESLLKRLKYTAKRYDYAQEQFDKAQAAVKAAPVRDYRENPEFDAAVKVRDNAERLLNMARDTYYKTVEELGPIGTNIIEEARQEATQQGIGKMIDDESKRTGLDTYEGRLLHGVNAGSFEKPALRMSPDEFLKSEFLWSMADRMVREAGGRTLRFQNTSSMLFAKREPAFDEAFMHLANYVFDKTGVGRQLTINDAREAIAKEQTDALMDRLTKPRDPTESAQAEWDQGKKTWIGNTPPPGTVPSWVDKITFYFRPTALMSRHEKQLAKAILDIAKQISPGVTVGSVDRILPPQGSTPAGTTMTAIYLGPWWSDKTGVDTLVAVTLSSHPIQSYLHEVIHHLRSGFFYPHEWTALEQAALAGNWIQHYQIDKRYTHKGMETQIEEAIAERYADWAYENVLNGVNTPAGAVRAFRKLKNFFDRLRRKIYEIFGRSLTVDDLFTKVSTGEIGARQRTMYGYDRFGARPGGPTDDTAQRDPTEAPALSRRDFLKGAGAAAVTAATGVPKIETNPFAGADLSMFDKNVEYAAAQLWKFYDTGGSFDRGVNSLWRETLIDSAEHNMEFGAPDDTKFYGAVQELIKSGWTPSTALLDKVGMQFSGDESTGTSATNEQAPAAAVQNTLPEPNDYMKGEGTPAGLIEHGGRAARDTGERAAGLAGSGGAPPYPKRPFSVGRSLGEIRQSLLTTWASAFQPEVLSDNALQADPLFARYRAARAQERDSILKQSESWWDYWNPRGDQERLAFLHEVETGQPPNDPTKNAMWRNFRGLLNRAFMEEQRWGSKTAYWEEYFPHVWTDVGAATAWVQEQVRQLGPTWFQKHRFYDTIQAGLAAGLRLASSNPVDLLTHRMLSGADMRMRMQLLYDLKRMGLAWESSQGGQPLRQRGWIPVNAPDRQQWMVAPDLEYLWKNAVEAKGLWQLDNGWGKGFRGWMMLKNAYVPIKLMLSLFHPLHVLHINQAQYLGQGLRELSTGNLRAGVSSLGHGLATLPTLGLFDYFQGRTAKHAWEKRKTQMTPPEAAMVKIMEDGGFTPQLSEEQRINARRSLAVAWQRASTEPWFAVKLPVIAARRLIEKLQAPIFEHWIPAVKAAAYLNEAASFFMRNPHILNDDIQYRQALRTIAKSVDNRFGEMFYGAVFQNRVFKDAMVASFLSYGWNFGFVREFIGGALEVPGRVAGKVTGETQTKQTQRAASNKIPFVMAYVSSAMMIAGLMSWGMSGEPPDNLLDYIFPRIGGKNSDGSPRRVTTMFYTREVPMLKKHVEEHGGNVLAGTAAMINNKLLIKPLIELFTNRDYYGYEIRNGNDPAWKQLWQHAQYLFEDATNPISVLGAKRAADLSGQPFPRGKSIWEMTDKETAQKFLDAMGAKGVLLSIAGFGPAPAYVEKTAIQNRIGHLYGEFVAPNLKPQERRETSEEVRGIRTAILEARATNNQDKLQDLYKRGRELGLSMNFMTNVGKIPTDVYLFSRLPDEQQISLIRQMSPQEKTRYWSSAHQKVKQLFNKEAEPVPAQ